MESKIIENGVVYNSSKTKILGYTKDIPKDLTIPDSVTSIGDWAFVCCTGLTSVTIGNSVASIGDDAFRGCTGLTSVTIGNSVTSIGNWVFEDCTGLTSVTIGNGVASIGRSAFYNCGSLTNITIPDSVTSIGYGAFYNCNNLVKTGYFKATNGNMTCRNMVYKLGTKYCQQNISLCKKGFHFCENAYDLFNYYNGQIGKDVRFFTIECEDVSPQTGRDSKKVCGIIKLVREITSYAELLNR